MENEDLHNIQQTLIEDISFIKWVKSEFHYDHEKWSLYIDEHMDDMDEINRAIKFVHSLEFKEEGGLDQAALWQKIAQSTDYPKETNVTKFWSWKWTAGIAAAFIASILVFKPLFDNSRSKETTFTAQVGKKETENFPDGSIVTLNPGSNVAFDQNKWTQERNVKLQGLAFFEVKKGVKFVVQSDLGSVTVLGTSFSVDTRNGAFEVICKTGKVAVVSKYGHEKILLPGDKTWLQDGTLKSQSNEGDSDTLIPWLDGNFTFENASYGDVIHEFENQYDVKVKMDQNLYDLKYTGYFKNNNINDALESITWPMKLKYRIDNKEVYITKE